ncbi:Major surface antigen 4 precursor [Anaplasma phagocytophilum]|nr:Major surface antigen 4 precursor [Anaplasma phagocytophilum]
MKTSATNKTAQCSGLNAPGGEKFSSFVKGVGLPDNKHWPTGSYSKSGSTPTQNEQNSNAKAVAKDLVEQLTSDEKTIVAGLLAKTIEGGEVVEIRAVSSTSVMVNACYDLLSEGLGVVPYACVGLGGNFVGVVDITVFSWVSADFLVLGCSFYIHTNIAPRHVSRGRCNTPETLKNTRNSRASIYSFYDTKSKTQKPINRVLLSVNVQPAFYSTACLIFYREPTL